MRRAYDHRNGDWVTERDVTDDGPTPDPGCDCCGGTGTEWGGDPHNPEVDRRYPCRLCIEGDDQ